jgi:hypothetical protein
LEQKICIPKEYLDDKSNIRLDLNEGELSSYEERT